MPRYQLLDLCGHAACLIADRDGVYDPSSVNGRLLLNSLAGFRDASGHATFVRA